MSPAGIFLRDLYFHIYGKSGRVLFLIAETMNYYLYRLMEFLNAFQIDFMDLNNLLK